LANFLSISPNQTKFLPYVCLVPAFYFSVIPASISAVSLRRLSTYILLDFKIAKYADTSNFLSFLKVICVPTYQHLAVIVFVPSVFGEKFPTAEF
jgi:hypothetical protein